MKICRIGIIGAGRIGKLHAENIIYRLPQFKLVGIADPFLDEAWATQLNIPIISNDANELLQHPDIDAILIASPSNLHTQQIMTASKARKAIFCEKPLGLSIPDIKTALTVIKENQTLLQVGFNRRFDPHFANLQNKIKQGAIGTPQLIQITSRDPACPSKEYCKTSGGLFMDMAIHDFDMARFMAGSEVVEVYATGSVLINPDFVEYDDVDTAVIQLRFANGALGVIDNSRQAVYGYDQRVEVLGSQGALQATNQTEHQVTYLHDQHTEQANPLYFFLERYQAAYLRELTAFHHAWSNQQASPVTGEDGLQALEIAIAAKKSLHTNQPITLAH